VGSGEQDLGSGLLRVDFCYGKGLGVVDQGPGRSPYLARGTRLVKECFISEERKVVAAGRIHFLSFLFKFALRIYPVTDQGKQSL